MRGRFIHLSTAWEVNSSGNSGWKQVDPNSNIWPQSWPKPPKDSRASEDFRSDMMELLIFVRKSRRTPDRKWTNYYYPHPSFPYVAWFGWTAANHPPKGSKSRRSFILPPSQLHWHAQSAHGHQHQPPSAYFTDPALCEGFHSLPVDESAKGSSEPQWEINMSRRKQAKPQHLRTDEGATRSALLRDNGRCPGGWKRVLAGWFQPLRQKKKANYISNSLI